MFQWGLFDMPLIMSMKRKVAYQMQLNNMNLFFPIISIIWLFLGIHIIDVGLAKQTDVQQQQ